MRPSRILHPTPHNPIPQTGTNANFYPSPNPFSLYFLYSPGLDCTSPLPLFNSLAHLVHLTATSPKIREILTRDGGLERLVRILREFVQNPPPVQDPALFYGLLPPIPVGAGPGNVSTAIASLNPSLGPPAHYHHPFPHPHAHLQFPPPHPGIPFGPTGNGMASMMAVMEANHNPALVLDPSLPPTHRPTHHLQPHPMHLQPPSHVFHPQHPNQPQQTLPPQERLFDRDAAQRFSLAFQCIVNVGVRGSESIRSRVVEAGMLEVVSTVLEAWLVGKGFPLVMPRSRKKRDAGASSTPGSTLQTGAAGSALAPPAGTTVEDERMEDDGDDNGVNGADLTTSNRPVVPMRSRNSTATPYAHSRSRSDGRNARPNSSSNVASTSTSNVQNTPRASTAAARTSNSNALASTSTAGLTRPGSSRNGNGATTPRYSSQTMPVSSDSIVTSANHSSASLATPLDTPSASDIVGTQAATGNVAEVPLTRGRSGTIVGQRTYSLPTGPSRGNSTDDMDTAGSGRSGANTEDEDMDAESSNNENDESMSAATSTEAVNTVGRTSAENTMATEQTRTSTHSNRPVAVADPQALSPHVRADSLAIPSGGPGMGMGMEVDVLAAVNMVMAHDGVAAFEGTQFGGEATNAAAAEAIARAGREGILEEETPRAVLRNMVMPERPISVSGELSQVDEEMGEASDAGSAANTTAEAAPEASTTAPRQPVINDSVTVNLGGGEDHVTLGTAFSPLGIDGDGGMMDTQPTLTAPPTQAPDTQGAFPAGNAAQRGPARRLVTANPGAGRAQGTANAAPNTTNDGPGAATPATGAANAAMTAGDRFKVAVGDAGPFRQEDVLRSLQLLAYLTKYPHVRQEFYKKRAHIPPLVQDTTKASQSLSAINAAASQAGSSRALPGPTLAQVAPVTAALAAGQTPQITTLFSLVERFTFRPSVSHLNLHPNLQIPTIPPEIQSWAAVIMRNACRKDDTQGGIRQCANMTCGKWERTPREFAKCRRCRKAKYCGKECQSKAWSMGHRYWCSIREGAEPGQVPPENIDADNDDGSTGGANGEQLLQATAAGTNTRGMGISIAPGGGVGLVPLNQTQTGQQQTTRTRQTATMASNVPTPTNANTDVIRSGPVIMNSNGYEWSASNPPPARNAMPTTNEEVDSMAPPHPIPSTSGSRQRDRTPNGAGTVANGLTGGRFARGIIRAFGANPSPPSTSAQSVSSTSTVIPGTSAPDLARPSTWGRLLGRGDIQQGPGTHSTPVNELSASSTTAGQSTNSRSASTHRHQGSADGSSFNGVDGSQNSRGETSQSRPALRASQISPAMMESLRRNESSSTNEVSFGFARFESAGSSAQGDL